MGASAGAGAVLGLCLGLGLLLAAGAAAVTADGAAGLREDVRALQTQLAALLQRRGEDFRLLEDSLRSSLQKSVELTSLRAEVDSLREEVQRLRAGARQRNDHVTVHWLSAEAAQARAQLAEQAEAQRNASAQLQRLQRRAAQLDLLRADLASVRSELAQQRANAQRADVAAAALRADLGAAQRQAQTAAANCADAKAQLRTAVDDWQSSMRALSKSKSKSKGQAAHKHKAAAEPEPEPASDNTETNELGAVPALAGRRRRHELRRQAAAAARRLERLAARVAALERSGAARGAALDKLRLSQLQLLEGQQGLGAQLDRGLPELRAELARADAAVADLQAGMQLAKEEVDNQRVSVRALAGGQAAQLERLERLERDRAANGSDPDPDPQADPQPDPQPEPGLGARVEALEMQVHRLQAVPGAAAAWPAADLLPANESEPAANSSAASSVPSLVRQLARVQAEYRRIVSRLPSDCGEVAGPSGLYLIAPGGGSPLVAACDQQAAGGGWTLVQRRTDGSQDFNRKWAEYADGFGSPAGEFWLGNEALHRLTADNCSSLRVELRDIYGTRWRAEYSHFSVGPAADGFRLTVAGYGGNASDALAYQQRMQFSAIDSDRDISNTHCAANYEGGWWFSHCQHANLNGRYNLGLTWFDAARNEWIAVAWSEMKVRRRRDGGCGAPAAPAASAAPSAAPAASAAPSSSAAPVS